MNTNLKVTGLYDQKSIELLSKEGITSFGFDFRVRSFNFLQQYSFLELIEKNFQTNHKYDLIYQDEKDFIIAKMIADLDEQLKNSGHILKELDNFTLHFTDTKGREFYDSFKMPYIWEYHPMEDLDKIAKSEYLKGIVLPYTLLEEYHVRGEFHQFVAEFLKKLSAGGTRKKISLGLKCEWKTDFFPSLNEFLVFEHLQLPVDSTLEESYRHISSDLVKSSIGEVRKSITV